MFNKSLFEGKEEDGEEIVTGTDIVFVSDLFVSDYVGGAELTTQALIDSSPFAVQTIHSRDVTMDLLESGYQKYWIFGNYSSLNRDLIPSIIANLDYSILEYDYKYCIQRSPERHAEISGKDCNCHNEINGKMISAFMLGAKSIWWMSEKQQELYYEKFPFLTDTTDTVLSSVFDDKFFLTVKMLREKYKDVERKGWIVLGSTSWIKGFQEAEQWCKDNEKEYEVVWDIPYGDVLEKLATAEGFAYLPLGGDTCPRMVIEAKLLGCELHINENVQHAKELWFDTDDTLETESYLYAAREIFWKGIKHNMNYTPTLSGYTTTLDCEKNGYPWKQSIESMLGFCDQVIVVDGGSTDGTWEQLVEWANSTEKLIAHKEERDWSDKRFAIFDGAQKALARSLCTMEFCWQQDADEVVHEGHYDKMIDMMKNFPKEVDIVCLPVVEYWGNKGKIRVDVNPWKWRLSKNKPHITHGIPRELRLTDSNGNMYAKMGTDGCDYINKDSGLVIPHANFYNNEAHACRMAAMNGNKDALRSYAEWFMRCVDLLPGVHHFSWFDLSRKINTYKNYWSKHWQSLYDIEQDDTAENNMFFQKPWAEVSESDISSLAKKLESEMGGWIFHEPVDFNKPTPSLTLESGMPELMKEYAK